MQAIECFSELINIAQFYFRFVALMWSDFFLYAATNL